MAEVTIRFKYNPATGKRELIIGYESDADALPHEHEREHRALAEQLLGTPIGDDTVVRVERANKDGTPLESDREPEGAPAREGVKSQG